MFTYKTADYKFLKTKKKRKTNEILKEAKKLC